MFEIVVSFTIICHVQVHFDSPDTPSLIHAQAGNPNSMQWVIKVKRHESGNEIRESEYDRREKVAMG